MLSHGVQHGFQGQMILMIITHGAVMGTWWAPPWLTDSHNCYQNKARKYCRVAILTLPAFALIRMIEISILIFDSKQITSLPYDNQAFMTQMHIS